MGVGDGRKVELGFVRVEGETDLLKADSKSVVDLVDLVCGAVDEDVIGIFEYVICDGVVEFTLAEHE